MAKHLCRLLVCTLNKRVLVSTITSSFLRRLKHKNYRKSFLLKFAIYMGYWPCVRSSSLRSWRYCRRARNKVLAAEPPEASGEAARNTKLPILLAASPLACRLRRQNFALTIPPATQANVFLVLGWDVDVFSVLNTKPSTDLFCWAYWVLRTSGRGWGLC